MSASSVTDALRRSEPAAPGLPRRVRWAGLAAAAIVGGVLGAATGAVAAARRDRPMHALGRTYAVTLRPLDGAEPSGVAWLDTLGEQTGLVRFSRGAGLPSWAPDVQGVAVRLPQRRRHTDLLFSSTGLRGPARFVLLPRRSALGGPASSVMPFRGPRGPLLLAVEPVRADRTRVPTSAETEGGGGPGAAPGAPPGRVGSGAGTTPTPAGTRWRLLWSGLSGPWHPVAELVVGADAGPLVDARTRFDPVGATPPGLPPYRWAAWLRSPSYRLSQLLGRGGRRGG